MIDTIHCVNIVLRREEALSSLKKMLKCALSLHLRFFHAEKTSEKEKTFRLKGHVSLARFSMEGLLVWLHGDRLPRGEVSIVSLAFVDLLGVPAGDRAFV